MDHPPVNALDVAAWFELADALLAAGRVPTNRVVVLRAEGRGFCAGSTSRRSRPRATRPSSGSTAAVRLRSPRSMTARSRSSPRSTASASAAASGSSATPTSSWPPTTRPSGSRGRPRGARCGHPPRPPGPQHVLRQLVYTARSIPAAELATYGSLAAVVPPPSYVPPRSASPRSSPEEPVDPAAGQGIAQRHRPGRREALLPLRAGLHLRAARPRRRRRAAGGLRREAPGRHHHMTALQRQGTAGG